LEGLVFKLLRKNFGVPESLKNLLILRAETNSEDKIIDFFCKHANRFILNNLRWVFGPNKSTIRQRYLFNVYKLHLLQIYKGWRYVRNLPIHGQRTWSNGWTAYRCNNKLKAILVRKSRKFYGNLSDSELYTAYMAEYVNKKWITHWKKDWIEARHERIQSKVHKKLIKIDLYSMARGHILTKRKFEKLSKKQKAQHNRNHYSLGFTKGFTKVILNILFRLKASMVKTPKYSKFILNKGDLQKNELQKKEKKSI